jgi:MoxR-like ATPase
MTTPHHPAPRRPLAGPFRLYTGWPGARAQNVNEELWASRAPVPDDPKGYIADPGLVAAANVALRLGQPLLITGEPGTGKTRFADSLAAELGLGKPERFETRSSSVANDLFYVFDALGRFYAAQVGESGDPRTFIKYRALGLAIIRSKPREQVKDLIPDDLQHNRPRRTVVLIDEVDKAPRDFPNDVLNEIENLTLRIPVLNDATVKANPRFAPIIVFTSNSERPLPDAFLRRCIYYNIPFPSRKNLEKIARARLAAILEHRDELLGDALGLFLRLRDRDSGLRKKPSIAELLGWLIELRDASTDRLPNPLRAAPEVTKALLDRWLGVLIKDGDDLTTARRVFETWAPKTSP